MFSFLHRFFKGSITLEARGFALDRFITLAVRSNIRLWNVKRTASGILFVTDIKHFRNLLRFAKKTGVHLKIKSKQGCPFFIYKYRKRYIFTAGIIVFAFFLFVMSSFIWLIEIEGNSKLSKYEIMSALNDNGLKTGCIKYFINTSQTEQNLKKELKEISWIHIKISGTRAVVEISEDIPTQNTIPSSAPCDIISNNNALITNIIATSGKPVVKVGDTVQKGSVLISADITYLQDGAEVLYGQVGSSGTIKGKVQRTFTSSLPYSLKVRRYTGNKNVSFNIKIFNANFSTNFIKNDVSFKKYDIIKEVKQLRLGEKFPLPVFVEKILYREYADEQIRLSPKETKKLCNSEISRQITEFYPIESDILERKCQYTENKECITATAVITAIENIGEISYIIPETTKGGNTINGTSENTDSE